MTSIYIKYKLLGIGLALALAYAWTSAPTFAEDPAPKKATELGKELKGISDNKSNDLTKDLLQTKERIIENAKSASLRLQDKDVGDATRKLQKQILNDLDSLIRKSQEPPQNSSSSSSGTPPKEGEKSSSSKSDPGSGKANPNPSQGEPKSGQGSSASQPSGTKKEQPGSQSTARKERRPRPESSPMPRESGGSKGENPATASQGNPKDSKEPKDPKDPRSLTGDKNGPKGPGKNGLPDPKRMNDRMTELYKDVWGHLPDKLRQEMDLYYREEFMPRYNDLLRQYFSNLAEQNRKPESVRE